MGKKGIGVRVLPLTLVAWISEGINADRRLFALTLKIGTMKVFWTIWAGPVRPLPWTGQIGLDKFVKLHCVDLVETIEMHI